MSLFLAGGHWNESNGAVAFKYVDRKNNGFVTFITEMVALQLNCLNHEVKEAVSQTILQVARLSSVIRLDARMILSSCITSGCSFHLRVQGRGIPSRTLYYMPCHDTETVPSRFPKRILARNSWLRATGSAGYLPLAETF
ncbi:hypothetical protein [Pajaroellobacter abortibovis]|nr:hypothetical protein [Pajaroellobacter abortibovis]